MMKLPVTTFMIALLTASSANATLIYGTDISDYSTNPIDDRGWSNTAQLGNSSSVYLANGWFISAYHVKQLENPSTVHLNSDTYSIDANSWTRLTNPLSGTGTDLVLFRAIDTVNQNSIAVTSSQPGSSELTMIGYGKDRSSPHYNAQSEIDGYHLASSNSKHWGTNESERGIGLQNSGYGTTDMYYTTFDLNNGEAQAVANDSGGGVFLQEDGEWKLSGIMLMASYSTDSETGETYYGSGNRTYIGNLATYASQISGTIGPVTPIPEPAALTLCLGGAVALMAARRLIT